MVGLVRESRRGGCGGRTGDRNVSKLRSPLQRAHIRDLKCGRGARGDASAILGWRSCTDRGLRLTLSGSRSTNKVAGTLREQAKDGQVWVPHQEPGDATPPGLPDDHHVRPGGTRHLAYGRRAVNGRLVDRPYRDADPSRLPLDTVEDRLRLLIPGRTAGSDPPG